MITYINSWIYGGASKFGYGSARGDPDVWIGLDHLCFGMDRGYGSGVWIGLGVQGMDWAVYFDLQLYIVEISWYLLLAIGMPWPALRLELDIETTIDIYLALATWSRGHMNFYVAKKRYCNQARRLSSARPPPKSFFLRFWVSLILIWNTISGRLHSLKLGYPQVHWIIIFPIQIAITRGISHQTHPYHATPPSTAPGLLKVPSCHALAGPVTFTAVKDCSW